MAQLQNKSNPTKWFVELALINSFLNDSFWFPATQRWAYIDFRSSKLLLKIQSKWEHTFASTNLYYYFSSITYENIMMLSIKVNWLNQEIINQSKNLINIPLCMVVFNWPLPPHITTAFYEAGRYSQANRQTYIHSKLLNKRAARLLLGSYYTYWSYKSLDPYCLDQPASTYIFVNGGKFFYQ